MKSAISRACARSAWSQVVLPNLYEFSMTYERTSVRLVQQSRLPEMAAKRTPESSSGGKPKGRQHPLTYIPLRR